MEQLDIHFLGTRGSMPVDAKQYQKFGGATVCTLIKSNNQNIILDAGSGFLNIEDYITIDENTVLHILISHTHLDHILGLLASKVMFNPKVKINIYGVTRGGLTIKEQINKLMQVPIWPINTDYFTANLSFIEINDELCIDDFTIQVKDGNHAGGASLYKLTHNGKKIIYATDFEINETSMHTLVDFAQNADFIICDGQYSDEYKNEKIGFGHSTWQDAILASVKANCKSMCVFHHDPFSTDDYLLALEKELQNKHPHYFFARKGGHLAL